MNNQDNIKNQKKIKEITLNNLKIGIPVNSIVGVDPGNIPILVEYQDGTRQLDYVFGSIFKTENDTKINVKFRNSETKTEYVR